MFLFVASPPFFLCFCLLSWPPVITVRSLLRRLPFHPHADLIRSLKNRYGHEVEAIQLCPGSSARVTFSDGLIKTSLEEEGCMRLRDREVPVFRPVIVTTLLVYNYPFDGDDMEITSFFEKFRAVRSLHKQTWTSDSDIYTGTSVVKIVLNRLTVIRRNVSIDGVKVKVWYKGQPVECDLCLGAHRVAGCPLKGKRLRCRQEGHIARSCPNPPLECCWHGRRLCFR